MKAGTLEEAKKIALEYDSEYNCCEEFTDAWSFSLDDGEMRCGGPHSGIVVLKESGKLVRNYEYFLGDKYNGKPLDRVYKF